VVEDVAVNVVKALWQLEGLGEEYGDASEC